MGGPRKESGPSFSSSSRSRLRWCVVPTKGSLSTPVGPAVLIRPALTLTVTPLDTAWLTHLRGCHLRLCSAPPSCLPTPPEPASLCHDELYHLPTGIIFPTNVITSPSTSRDLTVSPQHHYASTSTLSSSLPSSLPPHHTPSSPPSLSHHCPLSPAPPTITLNTALVVTPAPPSYPHPTPQPQRYLFAHPSPCRLPPMPATTPPPSSPRSPPSMNIY